MKKHEQQTDGLETKGVAFRGNKLLKGNNCIFYAVLTSILLLGCGGLLAENRILFKNDFEQDNPLQGWLCSRNPGVTPPDTAFGALGSETVDGKINHFYRGLDISFGISAILEYPYTVDNNTDAIEIKARVRGNGNLNYVGMDLSSREIPTFPNQFIDNNASGFGMLGYRHSNAQNRLYFYKNTNTPIVYSENKPLFRNAEAWYDLRLVYDHAARTLELYLDDDPKPRLIQEDVELEGVEFRSLWFMGIQQGADYDDIVVSVVEKNATK
ncbi:MAG: hypothetical protein WC765_01525 [Phycisphaerae bacterium]